MLLYKILILTFLTIVCLIAPVSAETIVYIPADDRPVNVDYVVETARAAGADIVVPPSNLLGSNSQTGKPDELWDWLFNNAGTADSLVVSTDSLLYGNLVASRKHNLPMNVIAQRIDNFAKLKALEPRLTIYAYSTIMRTPKASDGGEEPTYYETYGPKIFRITALRDMAEMRSLSQYEKTELKGLLSEVPPPILADWYARRETNFKALQLLIDYAKRDVFDYFLLGRDDCSPYSQTHMESRHLTKDTADMPMSKYASFPGIDEFGMLLITRAINNYAVRMPIVRVMFAPGAGSHTVPSYEDVPVGRTISDHILAAGGIALNSKQADLILAVNTPEDGITHEADSSFNRGQLRPGPLYLAGEIGREAAAGHRVAVADIAFGNGGDNALMSELGRRELLFKLEAYAGWNTASNTMGYAISQGMLAGDMKDADKRKLLAVRFLDDWAYQANIREEVGKEVLYPLGGSWSKLGNLTPPLITETERRLRSFAGKHFPSYPLNNLKVSFPWNRMFEIKVEMVEGG